jgi:tetratricopeptide (TPR) repeat protein
MTAGPEDQTTQALDSEPHSRDASPALPESIGPFRILGLLGEGGMGRVYRALERTPPREVALKVAGLPTRGALERFQREIELLAQLEHPGIARLYATGVDERSGLPWLSMELVHGEDLGHWAARVQPGRESSISVLLSICSAVQYAHGRGVLHRDLKPSNVFVTPEGDARVLDFGIARLLGPSDGKDLTLTVAGQILGTLPYMAPEQLAGEPVDARSDVYALGVIAYELLGGQLPYPRLRTASAFEALDIVRAGDPPPLASLSRRAQGDLGEVVMKAIAPERERRYASVDAFATDLRAALESRPVSARAPTPAYLIGRFVRRHRALSAALASIAVVLVLATGVSLRFAWAEASARAEAETRAAEAQAISDFLTDMLRSADPERSLGKELRVTDLLVPAANAARNSNQLQPLARVRVLGVLGSAQASLGDANAALESLESAQTLLGDIAGMPAKELRAIEDALLSARATALLSVGRRDEALRLVTDSLDRDDGLRDAETRIGLRNLQIQAEIESEGSTADAESRLRGQLDDARSQLGDAHPVTALLMHNLSTVLQSLGRWDEALRLNEAVVSRRTELFGADHPQTLYARNLQGVLLYRLGRTEDALQLSQEVLEARRRALGEQHPSVLVSTQSLGALYVALDQAQTGAELLRTAIDGFDQRFGRNSDYALMGRDALAQAEEKLGNRKAAELLYQQVLIDARRDDGSLRESALPTRNNLAMLYGDQGRHEEALAEYDLLLNEAVPRLGEQHPYIGMYRGNRAQCLAELDRGSEARMEFEASLAILRSTLGEQHPRTQRVQAQLTALGENR